MESRNERQYNWLWGLLLIFLGVIFLLSQTVLVMSELVWMVIMAGISFTFLAVFLTNREQWWALIPSYVFGAISGLLLLTTLGPFGFSGDLIAVYVLAAIGFPFLVVYALNRRNWWALIPAYVMLAIVGLLILEDLWFVRRNPGDITGAYVMLAVALPFLFVFIRNPENWWALIPGGIMLAIGLGLFLSAFEFIIPAALIIAGLYLLVRYVTGSGRRVEQRVETPRYGPEADRAPEGYEPLGERETGPEADHE